jgi:hypothetical protein
MTIRTRLDAIARRLARGPGCTDGWLLRALEHRYCGAAGPGPAPEPPASERLMLFREHWAAAQRRESQVTP